MAIIYNYTVIAVDEAAKCMEVVYTSDGHSTQHISARLPFEGESFESVIEMFAPIPLWEGLAAARQTVSVGASGTVDLVAREAQAQAQADDHRASPEGQRELRRSEYPTIAEIIEDLYDQGQLSPTVAAKITAARNKYPTALD